VVFLHTVSAVYITVCFLQERFQVKNPPHTYIQKLKGYLDPAVTRKVRWMGLHSWLSLPLQCSASGVTSEDSFLCVSFCQISKQTCVGGHLHEKTKGKKNLQHLIKLAYTKMMFL
jgi:hypothetical protein